MTSRRLFLKNSALALYGVGTAPLWMARAVQGATRRNKVLVAILQRGAMDGLNVVVPFGEAAYAGLRPNIGIAAPSPGSADSAIDLDGFFGLHPALAPLKPIYDAKQMAVIHAVGSPDPTRSHFDAQDYMESGTPGRKATSDGWLNRALEPQKSASPVRAVSLGGSLARTLRGPNDAVALRNVDQFQIHDSNGDSSGAGTFESMYENTVDQVLHGAGRETFEAVKLMESIRKEPYSPANGAEYPNNPLGQSLLQIARLIKSGVGLEVAFADMGGWDTHANETAQLQNLLGQFSAALAAFHRDLGDGMQDVCVVTMSEFGRTAKENGARGTDHGHANVMFAFGAGVQGGKVYGEWPGLRPEQLYQERDLAMTTDFRDVLGELVTRHLGGPSLAKVFPGYDRPKYPGLISA
ncbi:MAG: DUF1501 domain-containing protein [Acidobacteriota bacterium]